MEISDYDAEFYDSEDFSASADINYNDDADDLTNEN